MQNPNKPTKENSPLISKAILAAANDWQKLDNLMSEPSGISPVLAAKINDLINK